MIKQLKKYGGSEKKSTQKKTLITGLCICQIEEENRQIEDDAENKKLKHTSRNIYGQIQILWWHNWHSNV